VRWPALVLFAWGLGCGNAGAPAPDGGPSAQPPPGPITDSGVEAPHAPPLDGPLDTVVEVPRAGPYGTRSFPVPAATNWVNSGLYLRAGEAAEIQATGTWKVEEVQVGPGGSSVRGQQRGCARGSLAARSGLGFEAEVTCVGEGTTFVALRDGILFLGMIDSTDLGEAYGDRLVLSGSLQVTVTSSGDTVPSVRRDELPGFPYAQVRSGMVELLGRHVIVTVPAAQVQADLASAQSSVDTLDAIYELEAALRGMAPFSGQRIRFYPDEGVRNVGYMVAGNPVRCVPELMTGGPDQRILRASVPTTDIWGFAHELGHVFSFANGTWVFQYVNLESWPNIFTLFVLQELERTEHQPNVSTYCDGRDAYLDGGTYSQLKADPFLQLCFQMSFKEKYGWGFWSSFWAGMNTQKNEDVGLDGLFVDKSVWSYVRDRFSLAAGEDVTPVFLQWRVPVR